MPFDFGGGSDMYGNTVNAAEGLKTKLKSTFGWDDATAYAHIGISGMNGLSDQQETTTPAIWTQIRDWANTHHIARLAFWSVNRDRPLPGRRRGEQLLRHQPEQLAVHLDHGRLHRLRSIRGGWKKGWRPGSRGGKNLEPTRRGGLPGTTAGIRGRLSATRAGPRLYVSGRQNRPDPRYSSSSPSSSTASTVAYGSRSASAGGSIHSTPTASCRPPTTRWPSSVPVPRTVTLRTAVRQPADADLGARDVEQVR